MDWKSALRWLTPKATWLSLLFKRIHPISKRLRKNFVVVASWYWNQKPKPKKCLQTLMKMRWIIWTVEELLPKCLEMVSLISEAYFEKKKSIAILISWLKYESKNYLFLINFFHTFIFIKTMIMYYRKFQFNIKSDKYNFAYIKFIKKNDQ